MSLIPDTKSGKITFCEGHVTPWTTNAVAIGTTTAAVTAWSTQVTAARAALTAQQAAQLAAKNSTTTLNVAVSALMDSTASIIKQIRAKADLAGDSIYALASLPVPATPAPRPAPGKPFSLTVALDETGVLQLAWKCINPEGTNGTIYQVWRRIGEAGTLTYLGGTGEKKFMDDSLPAGSSNVMYQIQAVRSTVVGEWATFNVLFGVSGGGMMMVKSVSEGPTKMAA